VKTWDVIIVGGGIIGLSLAISLRKQGLQVLIVERGELGREASRAAAGMLAPGGEIPAALRNLAEESAHLYPEFVHELEDESGIKVDFREHGTILLLTSAELPEGSETLSPDDLHSLEPTLAKEPILAGQLRAAFLSERSVDPRLLVTAAIKAAKHRGVDISSGSPVVEVLVSGEKAAGVKTERTSYSAGAVVNCAGAWAGTFSNYAFPVYPVKGQMLAVVQGPALKHVVRSEKVYVVPRGDGRLVIGSTLENDGYNKQVDPNTIQRLFHTAAELLPGLEKSRQHDVWAGLRPGTPDHLPILGEAPTRGYFVATGHYRDGILLAPITASVMSDVVLGRTPKCAITNFSIGRFGRGMTDPGFRSRAS
jgi:glycine oxidase